jgi:outer membrane protein
MKKMFVSAALAAAIVAPSAASAQAVPAAAVAVVDLEKVTSACNACVTANAALKSQVTAEESREKALVAPLQAEQKAIQTSIDALNGKDPDAALQARVKAFQARQQQAQETASRGRQQLQRNQQYIQQQIGAKLGPIYQQVMQKRGANVLMETGSTLATTTSVDVTNDVVTALNAALPSISTNAPATAPQQPRTR